MSQSIKYLAAAIIATFTTGLLLAADPNDTTPGKLSNRGTVASDPNLSQPSSGVRPAKAAEITAENKLTTAKSFPAKNLQGLNVRNAQGEKLGVVDDLVVNLETGKVSYVALSVGGVLGIGDTLFAIPFDDFKFNYGPNEKTFVLNISKQRLEGAPGFNKDQWPDFADPQWRNKVDTYYRTSDAGTEPKTDRTIPTARD